MLHFLNMETIETNENKATSVETSVLLCGTCHQKIFPEYYFCPNCGTKIHEPPLSTTPSTQLSLYAFSLILPAICFLFVNKWKGIKYLESQDKQARTVGIIASCILIISTVLTFWYAYTVTQKILGQALQGVNLENSEEF